MESKGVIADRSVVLQRLDGGVKLMAHHLSLLRNYAVVFEVLKVVRSVFSLLHLRVHERVYWRLVREYLVEVCKIIRRPYLGLEGRLDLKRRHLLPINAAEENVLLDLLCVVSGAQPVLLADLDQALDEVLKLCGCTLNPR